VYELLQNAQDALKRRSIAEPGHNFPKGIYFSLYPDRLELRHYGKDFDEDDVKGITDILRGTKTLDKEQIGKFGIGFKSVYAFTESPEIHSGDEHFMIERYIRPHAIKAVGLKPGETLFVFPFNHKEKTAHQTYERIRNRLADLGLRTLLFLDEIDQIVWDIKGERAGAYIRDRKSVIENTWRVSLLGEEGKKTNEENWLVFQRPVNNSNSFVEIAFLLNKDDKNNKVFITPVNKATLYSYFTTEKETGLKFLIQGRYRTTPSRDNILQDDEFNKLLVAETAQLLSYSLECLRNTNQLTVETLETMPLNSGDFPIESIFRPIYDEFHRAMSTLNLLPSVGGEYIKAEEAKLARGSELIQLLPISSLKALFGFSKPYYWLSDDITRDKTPELRKFLMNEIHIDEIDPERFVRQITLDFLKDQSDEWFVKFYEFLIGQPALWRPSYRYYSDEGILRSKPFVRTQKGEMVNPFDRDGNVQVYLSGSEQTEFPIVKRTISNNPEARKFLIDLGLHEPDIVDEVLIYVLPKYDGEKNSSISEKEHLLDIKKISNALKFSTGNKKQKFVEQLQKAPFLRGIQPGNPERTYVSPSQLYIDDEILRNYFNGNPNVWFYDPIYHQYMDLLIDLGVERQIHMDHNPPKSNYVTLHGWSHKRGINGFDPEWEVDGLDYAVQNPTLIRSKIIWDEILRPNKHLIIGTVEECTRQTFIGSTKTEGLSIAGKIVREGSWLPDKEGVFHIPLELSLDDLPENFFRDEELSNQLGMKGITSSAFARERNIDEYIFNLGLEVMQSNPDLLKEFALKILKKQQDIKPSKKFNFLSDLEDTFSKPVIIDGEDDFEESPPSGLPNPERRRELTQEEILAGMLAESEKDHRFKLVPVRTMEEKDRSIRGFLYEEYKGKCQICGNTFRKRNGRFYFEGLYLVSRLNAQWVDRPGNVLCLCANCCAKFQYGPLVIEDFIGQIQNIKLQSEGGMGDYGIIIDLCGATQEIKYSERHLLDLQEMIKLSQTQSEE